MYEWNGLWVIIDKFDMILACDMYGMVGYKSDMELVWTMILYWLMEHGVVVVHDSFVVVPHWLGRNSINL